MKRATVLPKYCVAASLGSRLCTRAVWQRQKLDLELEINMETLVEYSKIGFVKLGRKTS